jgi:uncharacterized lipoprotein YddW (UPF0748 family)
MFDHMAMWTWPDAIWKQEAAQIIDRLQAAHIDTMIPYVSRRSTSGQDGETPERYEDRLRACITEAHRQGILVHACFDEINAYPTMPAAASACRQVRADGSVAETLCPANPEAIGYLLGDLERILTEFDYDGIGLEDGYIYNNNTIYDAANVNTDRYQVIPVCYCDYCRAHAPIGTPEWAQWKRDRMTDLIAAQSALIRRKRPGIPFSAAARVPYAQAFYTPYRDEIPYYSGWGYCAARENFSADWVEWLRQGLIDFACPMSYFHASRMVELQTRESQSLVPDAADKIWVGLGLDYVVAEFGEGATKGNHAYRNNGAAIARLLDLLESLGQRNCVFFSHHFLLDEHIPIMAGHRNP